jgi:hypothetical protein
VRWRTISLVTSRNTWTIKAVIAKPATGSAHQYPSATPTRPTSAPNDGTSARGGCRVKDVLYVHGGRTALGASTSSPLGSTPIVGLFPIRMRTRT